MLPVVKESAEKFEEFISSSKNVGIFFDDDADGVCSGVIIKKYLERKGKNVKKLFTLDLNATPFSEKFNEGLKDLDTIVFTDFNIKGFGFYKEYLEFKKNNPDFKVLIIDHHKGNSVYDEPNSLELNIANLQKEISGGVYCCSKFVYDIISILDSFLAKEAEWISVIGVIGDSVSWDWKDFVEEVLIKITKKFPEEKEIIIPQEREDIFLTPLGSASNYIFYGIAKAGEVYSIFEKVYFAKNVYALNKSLKEYEPIKKEAYDYVENYDYFMKNVGSEVGKNSVFEIEIKSDYNIRTIVSNILSMKNPDVIFLVFQKEDGHVLASVRFQNTTFDLGELMKNAVKDLEGANGGGHKAAAGAFIRSEDFNKFKENFYQTIEKK